MFSRFRHLPLVRQAESTECGHACLAMIAYWFGHRIDLVSLRLSHATSANGLSVHTMALLAEQIGLKARALRLEPQYLSHLKMPAVLHWDMNHFVVLTRVSGKKIIVHDPARGRRVLSFAEASRHFTGVALELTPTPSFRRADEREQIGSWQLVSAALTYKSTIAQILILSLALEVLAIAAPFYLQLVVDRVIVGRDLDFLTVLAVGFGAIVVIQAMVTAVRAWVGVYLSTQINLRMLTVLFSQLIRLPLARNSATCAASEGASSLVRRSRVFIVRSSSRE